jgi:hypothetical protein
MNRFLLLLCVAIVLLVAGASANDGFNDENTTQAQAACTALLNQCQLACGSHSGVSTTADCTIDNNGNVDLNCSCGDGFVPPSTSASIVPQVRMRVFTC